MYEFDRDRHVAKMMPHVEELMKSLVPHGIVFSLYDGNLENVVFKGKEKIVRIAYHCFFRFSGLCYITKRRPGKKRK